MAAGPEKWYFTREQLMNSPSRQCGLDSDKELAYRQQAANLIQDMGQRLQVSQLCINTAIVYMHRFYAFHSFTKFHRNAIAAAALFLAAKVEEQPRKLEYVIKVAHVCLHRGESAASLDPRSEHYLEQAQDLVFNENVLLQTLGFDVAIDHPHTHVVKTCTLVKAPKDLAQTSYFMASNSLHLTTMCLQYRPTVVACFCIHLASKWSNWAIPQSNEGRHWFTYVDRSVSTDLLEVLTAEFLHIFEKCPSRLKRKMMSMSGGSGGSPHSGLNAHPAGSSQQINSPFDPKKHNSSSAAADHMEKSFEREYEREKRRTAAAPGGYVPATTAPVPQAPPPAPPQKLDFREYREKQQREREERDRRLAQQRLEQRGQAPPAPRQPGAPPTHKPHHPWPHQKPPHHKPPHHSSSSKPPHENRHHRPQPAVQAPSQPQAIPTQPPVAPLLPTPIPQEPTIQRTRPPSLFSPENATAPATAARRPPQQQRKQQTAVEQRKRQPETTTVVKEMQPPTILSPFSSPTNTPVQKNPQRIRNQSNSEPELVPVVKKLDETPGFENVLKDSLKNIRTKVEKRSPPLKTNGIETDPTLVSNLLKESLAKPVQITVPEKPAPVVKTETVLPKPEPIPVELPQQIKIDAPSTSEHKHRSEKKKKKEKHKHKERDKSKDERKKHKKDREKDREKNLVPVGEPQAPIDQGGLRITIPKEKIATSPGLKIKIPKERLAVPPPPPNHQSQAATSGLKIKIPKEVLETSRKRGPSGDGGPPAKTIRNGAPHKVERSNGHTQK